MPNSVINQLATELNQDLAKARSNAYTEVSYDSARKVFKTRKENAEFEFPRKQTEPGYWCGTKSYASGLSSKVRIPRPKTKDAVPPAKK